jgi:hypothetical protein
MQRQARCGHSRDRAAHAGCHPGGRRQRRCGPARACAAPPATDFAAGEDLPEVCPHCIERQIERGGGPRRCDPRTGCARPRLCRRQAVEVAVLPSRSRAARCVDQRRTRLALFASAGTVTR